MRDIIWLDGRPAEAGQCVVSVSREVIVSAVAETFNVLPKDILSRSRRRRFTLPRHVAMWLCLRSGKRSTTQIGRLFGRDHTSVMHARRHVDKLITEGKPIGRTAILLAKNLGIEPPAEPLAGAVDYLSHVKQDIAA